MENLNLRLFNQNSLVTESPKELNSHEVISEVNESPANPLNQLEQTLATIFPTDREENRVSKARGILGESARDFTDEQLGYLVTDFEYLVDTWLDLFEKKMLEGKTLKEVIGESVHGNTK